MSGVIACQVPEISAGTHVNPGFWNGYDELAVAIPQVTLKHNEVIVVMVFVTFFVSMTTMLGQDIVTRNAERRVTILYERGYIGSALKHHLQIW